MKNIQRILSAAVVLSASVLFAGTYTWNGGAEGEWSDKGNWLCDGSPASDLPGDSDKVDLAGTKATIVLTENVAVGYFWAFQEGSEITVKSGTQGTRYALSIKKSWDGALGGWGGGFPGQMVSGGRLTLIGVNLFPNYDSTPNSQWGLNDNLVQFRSEATIEMTDGAVYVGKLGTLATLHLLVHDGSVWVRAWDSVTGLDVLLDDSEWSGFNAPITVAGDASFTFAGEKPLMKNVGGTPNPNVSGTLTFRYVLPEAPYAKAPVVNDAAVDFAPADAFKIEIDEDSPAFASGKLQSYRLMAYEKDAGKGLNLAKAQYPAMRTSKEAFSTSFMPGASTSGLPQYLDLTVDGAYNPDSKPLDVTFNLPAPSVDGEVFSGTVAELGSGATTATVKVKYGTTASMENEAALGTVTEPGPFAFTLGGLDPSETYCYQLVVTTDAGGEALSEAGTFSLLCGSVLDNVVVPSLNNGQGRLSGSLAVVGSGLTTVFLWLGRTAAELQQVASVETSSKDFSFDCTFADEGDWVVRFTCANSFGENEWTDTTSVTAFPVTIRDTCTYTLKSGTGEWTDPALWSNGSTGVGLGYPTSGSTVVFPADVESEVTLAKDVTLAQLTVLSANSKVTLKGEGVTLLVPSPNESNRKIVSAKGVNSELTLDGVKLTDNANVWSICWQCEPGDGSVIRLRNGARLEAKQINPQSDNVTIDAAGGSAAYLRESWNGNTHSFRVVLDDSTYEAYDKVLLVSEFVFKGTNPVAKVCNLAPMAVKLTYVLPEVPYAVAPLRQSDGNVQALNAVAGKQVTISIAPESPARLAKKKGCYPLVKWDATKKVGNVDTIFGIDTALFSAVEGAKTLDKLEWAWKDGVDRTAVGPQYLGFKLASPPGMIVLVK